MISEVTVTTEEFNKIQNNGHSENNNVNPFMQSVHYLVFYDIRLLKDRMMQVQPCIGGIDHKWWQRPFTKR